MPLRLPSWGVLGGMGAERTTRSGVRPLRVVTTRARCPTRSPTGETVPHPRLKRPATRRGNPSSAPAQLTVPYHDEAIDVLELKYTPTVTCAA